MINRLSQALVRIDEENARDPRMEVVQGIAQPRELVYGRRMSERLARFVPSASEALQIAVRAQHIRRWEIPRASFSMDRMGYRRWRSALAAFHAETTGKLLRDVGYDDVFIGRVADLLQKRRLKKDPEAQTLEDVACLVFLEHYYEAFARGHERTKLIGILRKTWVKMSERGHAAALQLPLRPEIRDLVDEATR